MPSVNFIGIKKATAQHPDRPRFSACSQPGSGSSLSLQRLCAWITALPAPSPRSLQKVKKSNRR